MTAGDPHGLNPWVDARGQNPYPPLLPHPHLPAEQRAVRFLGPAVRVRRGPRPGFLLVVAVLAAAVVLGGRWWMSTSTAFGPPAGVGEAAAPLGAPPVVPAAPGGYAFTAVQPDGAGPVAYSPCRPIHYVVRPDGTPAGGETLIADAVATVSSATGLRFVDDGPTQEAPTTDREAYQPEVYGRRWAPVLITWSTAAESPDLAGDVAGIAGSASVTRAGHTVYVTGSVTLDAEDIGRLAAAPGTHATALGIVTHELGHLVGLDHVADPTQLMYPSTELASVFGAGDRAGLAALGAGGCAPGI
ncbi:matrixin family metalloprotease [Cellulomonas fengjieae]|uniref:matrixin family metalloprotease n=1 Tax=Cellulomonas fengjieae TaxID=2819978 RepID=UPI001AAFC068|nr:matrixin family metalloprotease [Cellulomonas fengjieae]MBO3102971.1 matrixin family metalloprotease [Cellulomonas fengjieae]